MDFLIADSFTSSLARLTGDEQKAAKTAAFDLQLNPANPGTKLHRLERARDKGFWSARVNADVRLIVHRSAASLLLCYVDHHDRAYAWAERRRLQTHPTTGAAQMVEIRETVKEVIVPVYVPEAVPEAPAPRAEPPLFVHCGDDELLGYGVPAEWLADVRAATETSLLALADHLPAEAAEALLELATGGTPRLVVPATPVVSPFTHPDAQRRFRVMSNLAELEQALDSPWDQWTVFLHPAQRQWVERDDAGPARVSGSAGTGKTIVALHRAVHLARAHDDARVLLTTFTDALASALHTRLRRLVSSTPHLAERIDVQAIDNVAARLHRTLLGPSTLASDELVRQIVQTAADAVPGTRPRLPFVLAEWQQIVDPWQLSTWEEYRDVPRLGRKTRLSAGQRETLWAVFERTRAELAARGVITRAALYTQLAAAIAASPHPPYDFAVVDEAQDLGVPQLRFLAALGGNRPNALFFAGDLGQRIFQQPFSWKALGVDIRGRSRTLRVNYRTSHQIRMQADRLLGPEMTDVDGNREDRRGTVSVFNGPKPEVCAFDDQQAEIEAVGAWLAAQRESGIAPHEIGLIVRSAAELPRAVAAAEAAGIDATVLDEKMEAVSGKLAIATMHLAKGLEFRAVAVMACDDEIVPSQERIEQIGDDADLQEVYDTERHLLYVACTRARDRLLVTSVDPASEFLADLTA